MAEAIAATRALVARGVGIADLDRGSESGHDSVSESVLALLQLLTIGDVHDDDTDARGLAADHNRVKARQPVMGHSWVSRRLAHDLFDGSGGSRFEDFSIRWFELWPQVGYYFGNRAAELVVYRAAVDVGEHLIDSHHPEVTIDEPQPDRCR